eukprot:s7445_g3.t1
MVVGGSFGARIQFSLRINEKLLGLALGSILGIRINKGHLGLGPFAIRVGSLVRGACEVQGDGARESPDIFVFCFQEFSELSAANVVLLSSGDEPQQARFGSAAAAALKAELGESFWELRSCGMVGLFVGVFVAERLAGSVKSVSAERVRSGLYGQAGNKGAVAVSFKIEETSICAMSLHLESGQNGKKAQERLEQLREILQGVRPHEEKAKYDVMVLGGDFNFRAAFPEAMGQIPKVLFEGWGKPGGVASSERRVGEGSYQTSEEVMRLFREYDEVTAGRSRQELQEILKEFSLVEGPVRFPPTYRLLEGQNSYDLERQPAWCDRVLHSRVSVVRKSYCALGHLNHTDHRPVCVMLELLLLALPRPAASPTRTTRFAKSSHRNCPDTVKDPAKHEPVTSGSARSPSGGLTAGWGWAVRPGASEPCDYIGGFPHAGHGWDCTDPATGLVGLRRPATCTFLTEDTDANSANPADRTAGFGKVPDWLVLSECSAIRWHHCRRRLVETSRDRLGQQGRDATLPLLNWSGRNAARREAAHHNAHQAAGVAPEKHQRRPSAAGTASFELADELELRLSGLAGLTFVSSPETGSGVASQRRRKGTHVKAALCPTVTLIYVSQDVKIRDLKSTAAQKIFQDKLAAPLIEAIGEYFELPPKSVVVDDAFIVRYATDSQRGLSFHRDGSIVSSIVTLSDENDYVGGGTEFLDGSVYRPSQGGGILFGGQRLHGGVEIERGARYICTIFFKCGGLSCRDLAVKKDKEEEGDPGIWGALANIMGVGQ